MAKISATQLSKLMQNSTQKSRIGGGIARMNAGSNYIPKFKLEANSNQAVVIPLSLVLPFNPFDLEDGTYSSSNPFIFDSSVETAWGALRELCTNSSDVQSYLESAINTAITPDMWELEGAALAKLLKPVRQINIKGDYVCSVNLQAISQYEQHYRVPSTTDAEGITTYSGLLYELSQLEQAIIAPKMKELNERLKDGDLKNLNKKQKSIERQKINALLNVGKPRFYGVTRLLTIAMEGDEFDKDAKAILKNGAITQLEKWFTTNRDKIELFTNKLGTKNDKFPSCVIYTICATSAEPLQRWAQAEKAIFTFEDGDENILAFYPKYKDYRDDADRQSDSLLVKSIRDLREIDDATLLEAYQSNIVNYDRALFREEIVDKFSDLLHEIDDDFANSLDKDSLRGNLSTETVKDEEVADFLKGAEETVEETAEEEIAAMKAETAAEATTGTPEVTPDQAAQFGSMGDTNFGQGFQFS